jgi:lysophospholipase L1-like esterase
MTCVARILIVLIFTHISVFAEEQVPLPRAMAVLGDSISEGMFSEFSIERPPTLGQVLGMLNLAKQYNKDERINVFRKVYAKREHSWATGNDDSDIVISHFERLRSVRPDVQGYNFAVSGAKSADLANQVENLLAAEGEAGQTIDYLAILMGANDLSGDTLQEILSPMAYESNIYHPLRHVLEINPHRALLIVGLPHIDKVFEGSASLVAYNVLGSKIYCKDMRQNIYGKAIIFDPKNPQYNSTKMIIEMYRNALFQAAKELQQEFPAAYIKTIFDYDIPSLAYKSLSMDCFHPSLWGQSLLAEMTWRAGFWPDLVSADELMGN